MIYDATRIALPHHCDEKKDVSKSEHSTPYLISISVDKTKYMDLPFFCIGSVIHRPSGFGKTTFLKQLSAFCDAYSRQKRDLSIPPSMRPHYRRHLVLSFDLSKFDAYPSGSWGDKEELRERFLEFVTGAVRAWALKYRSEFDLKGHPDLDIDHSSLTEMITVLPLRARYTTMITIDSYDDPLIRASESFRRVKNMEGVIGEVLCNGVLSKFGGRDRSLLACVLIMGIGKYRRFGIFDCYSYINDHSTAIQFNGAFGFTKREIKTLIDSADVAPEKREILLNTITDLESCQLMTRPHLTGPAKTTTSRPISYHDVNGHQRNYALLEEMEAYLNKSLSTPRLCHEPDCSEEPKVDIRLMDQLIGHLSLSDTPPDPPHHDFLPSSDGGAQLRSMNSLRNRLSQFPVSFGAEGVKSEQSQPMDDIDYSLNDQIIMNNATNTPDLHRDASSQFQYDASSQIPPQSDSTSVPRNPSTSASSTRRSARQAARQDSDNHSKKARTIHSPEVKSEQNGNQPIRARQDSDNQSRNSRTSGRKTTSNNRKGKSEPTAKQWLLGWLIFVKMYNCHITHHNPQLVPGFVQLAHILAPKSEMDNDPLVHASILGSTSTSDHPLAAFIRIPDPAQALAQLHLLIDGGISGLLPCLELLENIRSFLEAVDKAKSNKQKAQISESKEFWTCLREGRFPGLGHFKAGNIHKYHVLLHPHTPDSARALCFPVTGSGGFYSHISPFAALFGVLRMLYGWKSLKRGAFKNNTTDISLFSALCESGIPNPQAIVDVMREIISLLFGLMLEFAKESNKPDSEWKPKRGGNLPDQFYKHGFSNDFNWGGRNGGGDAPENDNDSHPPSMPPSVQEGPRESDVISFSGSLSLGSTWSNDDSNEGVLASESVAHDPMTGPSLAQQIAVEWRRANLSSTDSALPRSSSSTSISSTSSTSSVSSGPPTSLSSSFLSVPDNYLSLLPLHPSTLILKQEVARLNCYETFSCLANLNGGSGESSLTEDSNVRG
ncbi:hypothetical protein D9757_009556 [Collybiopsis confluens]|uniref:AAA-ATPase-like domain-containing protein n=1 Tax=Collybiopsis confluens TaxID=2823264 RepID=A0A8H5H8H4_9AGAR|nr:hypothetical protein D9757_009556 [Collybiopsis confluens]